MQVLLWLLLHSPEHGRWVGVLGPLVWHLLLLGVMLGCYLLEARGLVSGLGEWDRLLVLHLLC